MKVRFWGTRGSLAKPGPGTVRYGGNTSCIQVESDSGTLVVIDCGTGAHGLGQLLLSQSGGQRGHLLISHTHWDHIQGIPFFAPLFVAGNRWELYAPHGFGRDLHETLAGQMEYTYFPVTLEALAAEVTYHNLVEGSFKVGDIVVRTHYLNHPALALGFRLEVDGATLVYACDHEPHSRELALGSSVALHGQDLRHSEFLRGADLVIHDAQYTAEEYPKKIGWGHSTADYALRVCRAAGVKRLALTHHDPLRDDAAVDRLLAVLHARLSDASGIEVFAAAEGMEIELRGTPAQARAMEVDGPVSNSALRLPAEAGAPSQRVLLASARAEIIEAIGAALRADSVPLDTVPSVAELYGRYRASPAPALLLLDQALAGPAGTLELARELHLLPGAGAIPLIVIATRANVAAGEAAGISDWLQLPFSTEYARTRMRAWLLRTHCRWQVAPEPENEANRLAALHALDLLDTEPEARFDRLTRLAAALFQVPVALVTLIDRDRQWFKSRYGAGDVQQTPREISFCAHAVYQRAPLVVQDTLLDPRFADNPSVTGPSRVRFYAGCPLYVDDGMCVGTLCVLDQKPRKLADDQLKLLADLAVLVEHELRGGGVPAEGQECIG